MGFLESEEMKWFQELPYTTVPEFDQLLLNHQRDLPNHRLAERALVLRR